MGPTNSQSIRPLRKLLTELGIRTEDAECKLMGDKCNFLNLVLIIKVVRVSTLKSKNAASQSDVLVLYTEAHGRKVDDDGLFNLSGLVVKLNHRN